MEKSAATLKTLELPGETVRYVKAGDGPPLVLVHGWALDHTSWTAQVDYFAERFTVIAYDWISTGPRGTAAKLASFQRLVDQLHDVIVALCPQSPVIAGHSLGGSIALQYAADQAGPLAALINVASSLPFRADQLEEAATFAGAAEKYGVEATVSRVAAMLWSEDFRHNHPDVTERWRTQYTSQPLSALSNSLKVWAERSDPRAALGKLTVPAQHLIGDIDACKSVHSIEVLASCIPNSFVSVIANAGHTSFVEKPEEFNSLVMRFLAPALVPATTSFD